MLFQLIVEASAEDSCVPINRAALSSNASQEIAHILRQTWPLIDWTVKSKPTTTAKPEISDEIDLKGNPATALRQICRVYFGSETDAETNRRLTEWERFCDEPVADPAVIDLVKQIKTHFEPVPTTETCRPVQPPADDGPFNVITGDPRFDPKAPAKINGYDFAPVEPLPETSTVPGTVLSDGRIVCTHTMGAIWFAVDGTIWVPKGEASKAEKFGWVANWGGERNGMITVARPYSSENGK